MPKNKARPRTIFYAHFEEQRNDKMRERIRRALANKWREHGEYICRVIVRFSRALAA